MKPEALEALQVAGGTGRGNHLSTQSSTGEASGGSCLSLPPPQGLAATRGAAIASAPPQRKTRLLGPGRVLSLPYHKHLPRTDARLWKLPITWLLLLKRQDGGIRPLLSAKRDSPGSVPLPYWY